ncbi:DUF885 domain-containing protein [Qipengyuania sediminis]|uniref:DUF885 domain-containing protein n=1 Tax=Qipengyuania sediminis TaxID=1532023 RepID=UPI00105A80D3|nr:DUF885 domain-containing protein [Qipengyuania sediminis]
MTTYRLALLAAAALPLGACATMSAEPMAASPAPAQADSRAALLALFERSGADFLDRNPVAGFFRGDFTRADRLGDNFSAGYQARERAAAEADLAALMAIDRNALGAQDRVSYDVFAYNQQRTLEQTGPAALPFEKYLPIDHFRGFHISYPRLSSAGGVMPFATVADYDNALKRHAQVRRMMDEAIARFREGMAAGVVQPRLTVTTMISQLDTQLKLGTEQTPYWTPIAGFPDGIGAADRARLTADMRRAIEGEIRPSLQKLRDFLANEYLPATRETIGLSAAKGGSPYYAYRIAEMTTLPLTAEEVHEMGLAEVARINAALAKARAEAGDRKPKIFRDKASLTEAWYAIGRRVDPLMPRLFSTIPRTPLEIRPYETYREAFNLAASYSPGNVETGKPGTFYFSGYNLENRQVSPTIALYMHEGNPGHHFETMLAFENTALPRFQRYGGFTAYSEGWGLYAEHLGYELGLYDDPLDRIGALGGGELLRAVRLVVDTGIHAKGWSREQAVDYMVSNGQPRDFAMSETARYTVMPAQALAYKLGELKIKALRRKAETALGDRFDVRAFHAQVLGSGNLPLPVLEAKIDRWIAGGGN